MNKTLRFSLLSMLLMLCGSVFADNVTVTFAAGTDKGTTTAEAPGEDHITKNGVTIAISNGAMATDQYRVYKGQTFTVTSSVGNITKIEVTCTANGTAKQGPGCLENPTSGTYSFESDGKGGVWTGNAAEVQFSTPSNQCRMTKVVVTVGEGGSDPDPDPDPDPQPDEVKVVTIAEFNAAAESTEVWYQLSGTVKNLKDGDQYGNFDLEDETGSVYVYGLLSEKGGAKKLFQELAAEKGIKNGTKITIIGNRGSYKEKIEVMNAYFVSVDGQGEEPDPDPDPQPDEVKVVTVAEFNAAAESTEVWYQLSGTVRNLKDGDIYGNFDLEDATGSVYVYGLLSEKGGAKKLFQELAAEKGIKNGTKITLIGNRGSYNDKIEVTNAYFVSVDGQEDDPDPDPQPDEVKVVTVAEFNAAAESTEVWYQLSGTVRNLKDGDIYGNFDLEDATGSVYVYGLLSEKGGAKKLFQELAAEKGIKNGTKITIIGNRGSYNDKIEVTNAYFVSVDGQEEDPDPQPDEIKDATVAEFNAAAESTDVWYKLSGEVKNLNDGDKYGNFDLEDATGSVYVYGLLSEKGGAKGEFQALAAEKGIKNGCKITIIGNRGSYKDKIEVTNAYFVSVDEAAPAELTISGETTFVESTVVTIIPSDVDHDVYYTLDGSDPKTSSTQVRYMEPFTITESCTVKAWEEDADIYAEKTFTKAEAPAEMTVEDVIAAAPESTNATDGQQKVWVKGYIVGFVDGAKLADGAKFTAEGCETATNLLLATNPAETNVENCIPVQLPSGDIRAALNLQDNPDNLGKEVKLYGYVLKYFSAPGLKNVTAYEFTGNTGVELQNAETIQNGKMYNLAGQRVSENYRGIVIMNGKKIIKK